MTATPLPQVHPVMAQALVAFAPPQSVIHAVARTSPEAATTVTTERPRLRIADFNGDGQTIVADDHGNRVAYIAVHGAQSETPFAQRDNTRHLLAAWNACTGVPTDWLEAQCDPELTALFGDYRPLHIRLQSAMEEAEQAKSMRDALLAALRYNLATLDQPVTRRLRSENTVFDIDMASIERVSLSAIAETSGQEIAPIHPGEHTHPQSGESYRIAADLAINQMKNSGALHRIEADRALNEQVKWGAK